MCLGFCRCCESAYLRGLEDGLKVGFRVGRRVGYAFGYVDAYLGFAPERDSKPLIELLAPSVLGVFPRARSAVEESAMLMLEHRYTQPLTRYGGY